jgi:hypothetical protein
VEKAPEKDREDRHRERQTRTDRGRTKKDITGENPEDPTDRRRQATGSRIADID